MVPVRSRKSTFYVEVIFLNLVGILANEYDAGIASISVNNVVRKETNVLLNK